MKVSKYMNELLDKHYASMLPEIPSEDLTPLALSRRILPIGVFFMSTLTGFLFKFEKNTKLLVSTDMSTRRMLHEIALLNILELYPLLEKMERFSAIEWDDKCSLYIIEWNLFGTLVYDALPYIGVLAKIESYLERKRNKEKYESKD